MEIFFYISQDDREYLRVQRHEKYTSALILNLSTSCLGRSLMQLLIIAIPISLSFQILINCEFFYISSNYTRIDCATKQRFS